MNTACLSLAVPGYPAVAVVRTSDPEITWNNLEGRKSCHTAVGRTAGWNIPMGLLLNRTGSCKFGEAGRGRDGWGGLGRWLGVYSGARHGDPRRPPPSTVDAHPCPPRPETRASTGFSVSLKWVQGLGGAQVFLSSSEVAFCESTCLPPER